MGQEEDDMSNLESEIRAVAWKWLNILSHFVKEHDLLCYLCERRAMAPFVIRGLSLGMMIWTSLCHFAGTMKN